MALCALVSGKMTASGSQTTVTFNHSIKIRTSFCFVVLVILFHTVNYFGFVVIIVLLPGFRGHLSVECGTEPLNILALSRMQLAFVFGVDFSDLHHVPVLPSTVFTDVVVDGVRMVLAVDIRAALLVLVLALAKVGCRPNVHLFDCRIFAAQLVNDRILIIYYQRSVFSAVTISLNIRTLSCLPSRDAEGSCDASRGCQGLAGRDRLVGLGRPAHAM